VSARQVRGLGPRPFSRKWWLAGLRTAGWVLVVTVLIWVYADIQFTKEETVQVTLEIVAEPADEMIVLSQSELPVRATIKGRKYLIDQIRGTRLTYNPAEELPIGVHPDQSVADILRGMPRVEKSGFEVVSATPRYVDIALDRLALLEDVPVELRTGGGELAGPAKLQPGRANLRVPVSQLDLIDPDNLVLQTSLLELQDVPPGKEVTRSADILAPRDVAARIEPARVEATFTVVQPFVEREYTVPVRVQVPKEWLINDIWAERKLEPKDPLDWTRKIVVRGPPIELEKLKAEHIDAYVTLSEGDLAPVSWLDRPVKVKFVGGEGKIDFEKLSLRNLPLPPVSYKVVRRQDGPG
jgi:hypothetical protein